MFLTENKYPVHRFWWMILPLAVLIGIAIINPFLEMEHASPWMYAENGILETLQWLIAIGAAGVGITCLFYCKGRPWLALWIILGTLGSLYIGLEEISYGQHLFKWETPEYWQAINDQGETNFHNTSSWFDQKPRLILLVGIIGGGLFLPFLRRVKPSLLPARFAMIYPVDAMFWTALCAVLAHAAKWAGKFGLPQIYNRASEVNEFFMYYFILLYLVFLLKNLKAQKKAA
ncbi:MAG: hypothetical protein RBS08_05095 [Bdellovibrionales bacterium]|jgi:hypothetical protein|nr:hypothetical protein [Bdellovibrionales bacterium]